jgi:hypothetical protein
VAHNALHGSEAGTVLEQAVGEAVAQRVGRGRLQIIGAGEELCCLVEAGLLLGGGAQASGGAGGRSTGSPPTISVPPSAIVMSRRTRASLPAVSCRLPLAVSALSSWCVAGGGGAARRAAIAASAAASPITERIASMAAIFAARSSCIGGSQSERRMHGV